jgi:RNA polymerase sigma-70 factor (sigma-E family)
VDNVEVLAGDVPDPPLLSRAEPPCPLSFAEFYRDAYGGMVRLAALLTGSVDSAQDLVQDAFVRSHRRWADIAAPGPYVRRAVVNACLSHRRRGRREQRAVAALRLDDAVLGADELFDALASLPFRQRAAVVLRFYEDQSEAEIAAILGCRPGTVGSHIHRGLEGLRKVLT